MIIQIIDSGATLTLVDELFDLTIRTIDVEKTSGIVLEVVDDIVKFTIPATGETYDILFNIVTDPSATSALDLADKISLIVDDLTGIQTFLEASDFNDLNTQFPASSHTGELAYVEASQGTPWLPGGLGGTYRPAGIYLSDGVVWTSDRNAIAQQLHNDSTNIGTLQTDLGNEVANRIAGDLSLQNQITSHISSITNHNDVNVVAPIANKSFLRWDGSFWSVYTPFYKRTRSQDNFRPGQTTEGLVNNTTTFETYLNLDINVLELDNYRFQGWFDYSCDTTTSDIVIQAELLINTVVTKTFFIQIETKDSGGPGISLDTLSGGVIGPQDNTGTNQMVFGNFGFDEILNPANSYQIRLNWRSQNAGVESAIYRGQISCEQKTLTV